MLEDAVSQSRTARYMYEYAGLLCDLGMVHLLARHLDDARRLAAEALALSRVQGARASEATALRLEGQVATQSDPLHEASALASLQEALSIAETLGARPAAAHCHPALGALHRRAGRFDHARAETGIAAREFQAMEMTHMLRHAENVLR